MSTPADPASDDPAVNGALTDCAVYAGGERRGGTVPLAAALERARAVDDGFVWIGMHDPTTVAVERLGREFDLHPLVVEDAIHAHQRPKLEPHGELLFLVLKTAAYRDDEERVEIGELMLVLGPRFVVSIRHGAAVPLHELRQRLEQDRELLARGPSAVFHAIADHVVDEYSVVLDGLSNDVDEIETLVFSDARANPTERVYRLKREVIAFRRAVTPLMLPISRLVEDERLPISADARPYLRDVLDHVVRDVDAVASLDDVLGGVLQANLAQISVQQNADARKISAWAAIAVVPTMIFGLYGMNFEQMPELGVSFGYPLVLAITLAICVALYRRLRRAGWL